MMDHGAHGGAGGWRMPPMSATMQMIPGLENALPPVRPFLIGDGMDPSMFPAAVPSRRVVMGDGDTLSMDVSLVRRTIGGRDYAMLGYDGQVPGSSHSGGPWLAHRGAGHQPHPHAHDGSLARRPG